MRHDHVLCLAWPEYGTAIKIAWRLLALPLKFLRLPILEYGQVCSEVFN